MSSACRLRMRMPILLAFVALGLAGCNANQAVNPSSQPPSQVFAGHYVDTILTIPSATRRTTQGAAAAVKSREPDSWTGRRSLIGGIDPFGFSWKRPVFRSGHRFYEVGIPWISWIWSESSDINGLRGFSAGVFSSSPSFAREAGTGDQDRGERQGRDCSWASLLQFLIVSNHLSRDPTKPVLNT